MGRYRVTRAAKEASQNLTRWVIAGVVLGVLGFAVVLLLIRIDTKSTQRRQRLVYEEWHTAKLQAEGEEKSLALEKQFSPNPARIAEYQQSLEKANKRKKDLEEESNRRWGVLPSAFSGYPGSETAYYNALPW